MPKTTKLSEYEEFKQALKTLEDPDIIFARCGDYVISTEKKLNQATNQFNELVRLRRAIYTRA